MKLEPQVILSRNEEDRVAQLGAAFRKFLGNWFQMVVLGVRFSPGVSRELAMAFLEMAAAALIAPSDAAEKEPDEQTSDRCLRAAREAFAVLEREVVS